MVSTLLKRFSNRFISKWLILVADLVITLICFSFTYLIRFEFSSTQIASDLFRYHLLLALLLRAICFLYYKTYVGIIRHTSFDDAYLLFKAVTTSAVFLLTISFVTTKSILHIPTSIILIDALISLFILLFIRLMIKGIYEQVTSGYRPTKKVVIYGNGEVGRSLKNTLQNSKPERYEVLYFIDDNPSTIGKSTLGVPVISRADFFDKFGLESVRPEGLEVVLAIQNLTPTNKAAIANQFLEVGIVLKSIPKISELMNEEINVNKIKAINIEDLLDRDPININSASIGNELRNKTVMVTGAAGSIGSEIVKQVLSYSPKRLILIDQAESALYDLETDIVRLAGISTLTDIQFEVADITNFYIMERHFETYRPSYVFHAAAYKHVPLMEKNPYNAIKTNVFGSKLLADMASRYNVSRFVMISTDKAVNPTNVMGATKRLAEMYIQSLGSKIGNTTEFITTRFGNVLDSNGSVVPLFRRQIAAGGPLTVTHKDITRYFMTIPEACQLVLEAGTMGRGQEVYVFDMGQPIKIYDLALKMVQLAGLQLDKDIEVKVSGLRPGEKLYEELLATAENTVKTYHPKIMIAKVNPEKHGDMSQSLDELALLLESGETELVSKLKEIVPEYVSNNSVYEALDRK